MTQLSEYRATWFDHLRWEERQWDVLAESEAQVRTVVDAECKPEFRKEVYTGKPESERADSLKIEVIVSPVTLPFVTHTDL